MNRTITLAGGCFWGMEELYRRLPGVAAVTPGYANGDSPAHADYQTVCTGDTGFREAVQVVYDPALCPLERLLFTFFAVVDLTTPNKQGPDVGTQYQSGIYWSDPGDEALVRRIAAMEAASVPVFAVELKPLDCFYPAEDYHQRYLQKNPGGYCHISVWHRLALPDYPFRVEDYTRPAAQLLADWAEKK